MQTLSSFKKAHSIDTLEFFKGNKREFASVTSGLLKETITLIISENYVSDKPAFVSTTTNTESGEQYKNTFTIHNADVTATRTM